MQQWPQIEERMKADSADPLIMRIFRRHVEQVASGGTGWIREEEIEPVADLADLDTLGDTAEQIGREAVDQAVILKLNGGLGTGMGLNGPKSLLPVREGKTFLDLIIEQARALRRPLWLMNSFATQEATQQALDSMASGGDNVHTFQQHRVPKLSAENLSPAECHDRPELTWCPPGHGDLYAALVTSGALAQLISAECRYLFVSNADNLGATLDPRVLGFMVRGRHTFVMEVADRTDADRKGGHLARRSDGTLLLRESAQCHDSDRDTFQDIRRHRYFNTNNLWIDLHPLAGALKEYDNDLPLSLIVNGKPLDPADTSSALVVQLETAMGSAISVMPRAAALRVPRSRFAPVKNTGDLLAVRSDAYRLDNDSAVRLIDGRKGRPPLVQLDSRFYRLVDELDRRIRQIPSLEQCSRLTIEGEFQIDQPTRMIGDVHLKNEGTSAVHLEAGEYANGSFP